MKKLMSFCLSLMATTLLKAQNDGGDFMRNTGKIYVVIGAILIIFIGIIIFLVRLDKKITELEQDIKNS